jgi:hypothetical protein
MDLQQKTSSLTAKDSLHSRSRSTTDFILFCTTYVMSSRTQRKHMFYCWQSLFTSPLRSNICYTFLAFASEGMCLATRCLAMGMGRTRQKTFLAISFLLLRADISGVT